MNKYIANLELTIRTSDIEVFLLEKTFKLLAYDKETAAETMFELVKDPDNALSLFGDRIDDNIRTMYKKGDYQIRCEIEDIKKDDN